MRKFIITVFVLIVSLNPFSVSEAQMMGPERSHWLLGVIFKLETMRDKAIDLMIERGMPINHWRELSTRCYESSEILPFGPALRYLRALGRVDLDSYPSRPPTDPDMRNCRIRLFESWSRCRRYIQPSKGWFRQGIPGQ